MPQPDTLGEARSRNMNVKKYQTYVDAILYVGESGEGGHESVVCYNQTVVSSITKVYLVCISLNNSGKNTLTLNSTCYG